MEHVILSYSSAMFYCKLTELLKERYETSVAQLEKLEKRVNRYEKLFGALAEEEEEVVQNDNSTSAEVCRSISMDLY